jgi:proteasome accessory factor B
MRDDHAFVRQWNLIRSLSGSHGGQSVQELVSEMGVSEKTVRRDLDLLRRAGLPLEEAVGDFGRKRWRIRGVLLGGSLAFTFEEALALYLGRRFLDPLAGTVFFQAAQQAFRKIRSVLGRDALAYLERLADRFHYRLVGASDYSKKADLLDDLLVAIEDSKQSIITYQSQRATEPVEYEVHPYGLAFHRGSLYLVAWSRRHDQVRHFKLDRVAEVEITNFPFERPKDFDLSRHLAGSFGIYHGDGDLVARVRFRPAVARYVLEGRWHASQKLTREPDGSVLGEFRLSSTTELKAWVLSFGANAVVLEPDSLRREIAEELRKCLAAYPAPTPRSRS